MGSNSVISDSRDIVESISMAFFRTSCLVCEAYYCTITSIKHTCFAIRLTSQVGEAHHEHVMLASRAGTIGDVLDQMCQTQSIY